ncbi:MAG: YihY family inner membrane protein, partial [Limnohabitans sp.]|jgi:membrane protein
MIVSHLQKFMAHLAQFPWANTARVVALRFREDRLGQTAGSLTFTTLIALVPFVTVALAVFTVFPMFSDFQAVVQKRLVESLVPDNISRQVLGYLTLFANKASRLGAAGVTALILSALALVFTIDRTLNAIWRVKKRRPFAQRLLLYWTALTLGPLLMGVGIVMTTQFVSFSQDFTSAAFGNVGWLLSSLEYGLFVWGVAALYRYVPYTQVPWSHALVGGVWVVAAITVARNVLAYFFGKMSTYSMVYGAFATLPILFVWIYLAWTIVLMGAVFVANLSTLLSGVARDLRTAGWRFELALEVLQHLNQARHSEARGASLLQLCSDLRLDPLQVDEVLATLVDMDWIGRLSESADSAHLAVSESRYILLVDTSQAYLAPLMARLLLKPSTHNQRLWAQWQTLRLADVI